MAPPVRAGVPVPFYRASITDADVEAVATTLRSGWLTLGPRVGEFEAAIAAHTGSPHAVATSSCTTALFLALRAFGIGPGDEVIVPSLTFAATVNTVLHCGATPVLADIELESFGLDPEAVAALLTPRTRGIVTVDYAGHPSRVDALRDLARAHGLFLIEDAAHSFGAALGGRPVGSLADATAFSFYATKCITTGEGGMLTCADAGLEHQVRLLGYHGMARDAWRRYSERGSWYYEVELPGYKCNMTDVQAALGLSQLRREPELRASRTAVAATYLAGLSVGTRARIARGAAGRRARLAPVRDPPADGRTAVRPGSFRTGAARGGDRTQRTLHPVSPAPGRAGRGEERPAGPNGRFRGPLLVPAALPAHAAGGYARRSRGAVEAAALLRALNDVGPARAPPRGRSARCARGARSEPRGKLLPHSRLVARGEVAMPQLAVRVILVEDAAGTLQAAVPLLVAERWGVRRVYAGAWGTYGGVVARSAAASTAAAGALAALARAPRTALVRVHDFAASLGSTAGWLETEELCLVLDLPADPEVLFHEAFTTQNRNKIRKAEKLGVTVRRGSGPEDLGRYADLYAESAVRWGFATPLRREFFLALAAAPAGVEVWLAERAGEVLAGLLNFNCGGQVMNWGNVSRRDALGALSQQPAALAGALRRVPRCAGPAAVQLRGQYRAAGCGDVQDRLRPAPAPLPQARASCPVGCVAAAGPPRSGGGLSCATCCSCRTSFRPWAAAASSASPSS